MKQLHIKRIWHGLKKLFKPNYKSTTAPRVNSTRSISLYEASLPVPVPEGSQAKPARNKLLLENFPADIRRHFLFTLDYGGLRALVHASPVYHQQYLLDRQYLLCGCLRNSFGWQFCRCLCCFSDWLGGLFRNTH